MQTKIRYTTSLARRHGVTLRIVDLNGSTGNGRTTFGFEDTTLTNLMLYVDSKRIAEEVLATFVNLACNMASDDKMVTLVLNSSDDIESMLEAVSSSANGKELASSIRGKLVVEIIFEGAQTGANNYFQIIIIYLHLYLF